jgi:uncharacterized membrane-anchored protein
LVFSGSDLTASQLHLGFVRSIMLFAVVMAVPALGYWRLRLNSVIAFWWAYIVTRPLGASIADWFSKPTKAGALGCGDSAVAAVLLVIIIIMVTFVAVGRPVLRRPRPAKSPTETAATPSTPKSEAEPQKPRMRLNAIDARR